MSEHKLDPKDFAELERLRAQFNQKGRKQFKLLQFGEIRFETNQPYVVKSVIPKPSLSVVWGKPKCGKTFWCLDLAMHIALGEDFHGRKVVRGHVVYCALEGKSGIAKRIEAYRQYKLNNRTPDFSLMLTPLQMIAEHENLISDIRGQVGDKKPAAIFIDTLNRSIDGSENEDKVMTAYLNAASAIMDAFECAVIIIHHCGHSDDHPRGHSSILGNCDVIIKVTKDASTNINTAKIEFSKNETSGEEFAFKLRPVELGNDDEGEQVTSCVVDTLGAGESVEEQSRRDARDHIRLLQAIAKHPRQSESAYATAINKTKSSIHRCLARLLKDKLITMVLDKPRITPKGRAEIDQYEADLEQGPF